MGLSEAEIQLLACLFGAGQSAEPTDRASLERRGDIYWIFREDWSVAFTGLLEKGLIGGDDAGYRLTDAGRPLGEAYFRERPDHYWYYYQRFYPAAAASAAHSRFCERVFGADLCQEGQTDMAALHELIDLVAPAPDDQLLDLGCGAGGIAEYLAGRTGARVTGLDRSAPAIATAQRRTADQHERLRFVEADLNHLELADAAYDAAIAIDSVYWMADLDAGLGTVVRALRPGGQLAVLVVQTPADTGGVEALAPERTPVATALSGLGLDWSVHDCTERFREFWPRVRAAALALRAEFEGEGNGFICDNWLREADQEYLPAIEAGEIGRYLYHARV